MLPRSSFLCLAAALAAAVLSGCDPAKTLATAAKAPPVDLPPEPWAAKPLAEWPQMLLTNKASLKGHGSLDGAAAFLILARPANSKADIVMAATAFHVLGGEIPRGYLDDVIDSWDMFPRTMPMMSTHVVRSIASGGIPGSEKNDWLLLQVDKVPPLVAYLRLRPTPVAVGETVHLVGVPYSEPGEMQKVYSGKVTARAGHRFRHDISPPVDIQGFSGGPVVDENGWVVGVMGVWFQPRKQGKLYLESGGEDCSSAFEILRKAR